jgi:hypothetical protein
VEPEVVGGVAAEWSRSRTVDDRSEGTVMSHTVIRDGLVIKAIGLQAIDDWFDGDE